MCLVDSFHNHYIGVDLMYSPKKFANRVGDIGQSLPDPFTYMGHEQVKFRFGATSMIAGVPGSFKSVFGLNMVVNWARTDVSALYFSADSEEFTVAKRLSGILTDEPLDDIERAMLRGDNQRYVDQMEILAQAGIEFEYESMGIEEMARRIASYEAVYGAYPNVIFVDNLIDFVDSPDDWGGMLMMTRELDSMARKLRSHICILHHAKIRVPYGHEEDRDWGKPPADYEIQGKITQEPRLVLTMAATGLTARVACVKNTNGPQYPDASRDHFFNINPSMRVVAS